MHVFSPLGHVYYKLRFLCQTVVMLECRILVNIHYLFKSYFFSYGYGKNKLGAMYIVLMSKQFHVDMIFFNFRSHKSLRWHIAIRLCPSSFATSYQELLDQFRPYLISSTWKGRRQETLNGLTKKTASKIGFKKDKRFRNIDDLLMNKNKTEDYIAILRNNGTYILLIYICITAAVA